MYRESETEEPGEATVTTEVEGWKLGLTVCYDLRFPELYRVLAVEGAEVVTVPAAFTLFTGKDHWELLLRARAVENQCLRRRGEPVGQLRGRQGGVRALSDRRPLGSRARRSAGRGLRHLRRDRPRADGGHPPAPSVARQPPAGRLPLADGRLTVEAVLFDVDFTLGKPGPLLGPGGYHEAGQAARPRARRRALRRGACRRGRSISSSIPSSSTTRKSGSASPRTSSAAWAVRARRAARSRRRSRTGGSPRRTSSSTRTCLPVLRSSAASGA